MSMDNQQERPIVALDFIAGLIVGEGHIGLNFVAKNGRDVRQIYPAMSVQMNDLEAMEAVAESSKVLGFPGYVCYASKGKAIRIEWRGFKRLRKILPVLLPKLLGKKKLAAEVVWRYIELRSSKKPRAPYGAEEAALVNKIRDINSNCGSFGKRRLESSETLRPVSVVQYSDKDKVLPVP